MNLFDAFRYDGRHALVVGGATGMGAAVVDLLLAAGADVTLMDRVEVKRQDVAVATVDMSERSSIDGAVDGLDRPVDALFSCAGVADGTPGIERINFLGHRHMIDRLLERALLPRGSAIGLISSAAGFGWEQNLPRLRPYLDITDFDKAAQYAQDNKMADYLWSKLAINAYVAREAFGLLQRGVRINAILPGPTDTPLARANADTWLSFAADYREATGTTPSAPLEQAYPLVFLCSSAASGITGITLISDAGYFTSGISGSFENATGAVEFMRSEF